MKTVHDLKDLAMIYHDCDKYEVKVWQPDEQRSMRIVFCGSSKPIGKRPGEINFVAYYNDNIGDNCVMEAFRKTLGNIICSSFDMSMDWEKDFLKNMVELRANECEKEEK